MRVVRSKFPGRLLDPSGNRGARGMAIIPKQETAAGDRTRLTVCSDIRLRVVNDARYTSLPLHQGDEKFCRLRTAMRCVILLTERLYQTLNPTPCRHRVPTGRVFKGPVSMRTRTEPLQRPNIWACSTQTSVNQSLFLAKPKYWGAFLARFTEGP